MPTRKNPRRLRRDSVVVLEMKRNKLEMLDKKTAEQRQLPLSFIAPVLQR